MVIPPARESPILNGAGSFIRARRITMCCELESLEAMEFWYAIECELRAEAEHRSPEAPLERAA
ncbi:hypothetical protein NCCP2165_20370 [Halomonas sp. NCCP-2165]|nr:hypothetical protein NCCP2165_20370 [Halomonas sp. NCCP-2165]